MSNLVKRLVTALIGAAILVGLMYSGTAGHVFILGIITAISLWELQAMGAQIKGMSYRPSLFSRFTFVGFGLLSYLVFTAVLLKWLPLWVLFALVAVLFLMFIVELYHNKGVAFVNVGILCLGVLYIALPMALGNKLSHPKGSFYIWYTLLTMLIVWFHDVFAYFIGRKFGKKALFKRISPNKTWEGTIGGFFGVLLIISVLALKTGLFSAKSWVIFGLVGALGATFGDLFESLLKRSVGIKDSGSVLPGHGGFLDRFDALFFVIPLILVVLIEGGYITF